MVPLLLLLLASVATGLVINVNGNKLVDGAGATLSLRGVDRSGFEFACAQGAAFRMFPRFSVAQREIEPLDAPCLALGPHVASGFRASPACPACFLVFPFHATHQGNGFSDGPVDAASVAAISAWNVNVVRVPLNEACWLALAGVNAA